VRAIKAWWLVLAFVGGIAFAMMAEELRLNWRNNRLELSAPHVPCFDQMSTDMSGVGGSEPLWLRVEIRAEDGKSGGLFGRGGRGSVSEAGISLSSLIEIFSRPAQQQSHWGPYDIGPFTVDELKRADRNRRGS
jgi:hypothetical protein